MDNEVLVGAAISLASFLIGFAVNRQTTKNDRGTHISEVRFDKEFEIYQELSEKNLTAVYDAGLTVPIVRGMYQDTPDKISEHLEKLGMSMDDAEFSNKKFAPFINKEIFQKYKNLESMIKDLYKMFGFWTSTFEGRFNYKGTLYSKEEAKEYIESKQKEISALSDEILDDVRDYLQKLVVIQ